MEAKDIQEDAEILRCVMSKNAKEKLMNKAIQSRSRGLTTLNNGNMSLIPSSLSEFLISTKCEGLCELMMRTLRHLLFFGTQRPKNIEHISTRIKQLGTTEQKYIINKKNFACKMPLCKSMWNITCHCWPFPGVSPLDRHFPVSFSLLQHTLLHAGPETWPVVLVCSDSRGSQVTHYLQAALKCVSGVEVLPGKCRPVSPWLFSVEMVKNCEENL